MFIATRVANYELHSVDPERRADILQLRRPMGNTVRDTLLLAESAGFVKAGDIHLATVIVLSLGIDVSRWFRPEGSGVPDQLSYYSGRVIAMFRVPTG